MINSRLDEGIVPDQSEPTLRFLERAYSDLSRLTDGVHEAASRLTQFLNRMAPKPEPGAPEGESLKAAKPIGHLDALTDVANRLSAGVEHLHQLLSDLERIG